MWWKRKPEKAPPKLSQLIVNLEWPDGNGFTQCSNEYFDNSISLEHYNPCRYASSRPEDYEQYAALLRERDRLIEEGHTGKSFRYDQSRPAPNGKLRVISGFFAVERHVAVIECPNPASRVGVG